MKKTSPLHSQLLDLLSNQPDLQAVQGQKIAIACSGGKDSMALAMACVHLRRWEVLIFTVDHGIHEQSSAYANAIKSYWQTQGIQTFILKADPQIIQQGLGVEDGARRARYALLSEMAVKQECHWVLLAHHAQDQAETILMRLNQSAGLAGLKGIPAKRDIFLRPFLQASPSEINRFIEELAIPYWEDPTNRDLHYQRNHVRFEVNQALEKVFHEGWQERFAWSAYFLDQSLSALDDFLKIWDQQYLKLYPAVISYEHPLIDLSSALQQQCLVRLLTKAFSHFLSDQETVNLRRIKDHIFRLQALWAKEKYRQFQMELPYQMVLTSTAGKIKIYEMTQLRAIPSESICVDLTRMVDEEEYVWGIWKWRIQRLSKQAKGGQQLWIGLPQIGAVFSARQGQHKKIRHLWGDLKSSIVERSFWPVLQTDQGEIIYAPDLTWSNHPLSINLQKEIQIDFLYNI
jgi:tRNA(Ile)-lysidine synthetase-like protein